ncbi:MAG TPA: prepilin-type N-terminal cleavage/methylation domain-containing protein [Acidimicrobiia bacterium]|jgi:type IV pilus assembly protein PilA
MRTLRERLAKDDGFTLIELMVVVLIIAVLVAIAIPSFLGFRARAQDRAAQSDIRNVLLSEKAYWTDTGAFTETESDLKGYEPSIETNTTSSATQGVFTDMSVASNDDVVCLTQASDSGNFFAIFEDETATGGTYYGASAGDITCPSSAAAGGPSSTATVTWSTAGFPAAP